MHAWLSANVHLYAQNKLVHQDGRAWASNMLAQQLTTLGFALSTQQDSQMISIGVIVGVWAQHLSRLDCDLE